LPLLAEGRLLAPQVTAMMDVSDGLLLDATRMARASGVTFAINREAVPIATPEDRRDEALRWGDDYQLLFTLPAGAECPVPAHRIGLVRDQSAEHLLLDGEPPQGSLGYEHE
jgi:thiamine-monophosphate kinase